MNIDLYCNAMQEIKLRTSSISSILKKETTTAYPVTNIEFMCLQLRKILELIAMASLVANKTEFDKLNKKYASFWHAERILNDIENLNPNFYPVPIIENISSKSGVKSEIENKKDGFLTRTEFVKVYEKCGKMMHASNPFGSQIDFQYYEKEINEWLGKIMSLLNSHTIKLIDDDDLYIIHMQEERDEKIHFYSFGKNK